MGYPNIQIMKKYVVANIIIDTLKNIPTFLEVSFLITKFNKKFNLILHYLNN